MFTSHDIAFSTQLLTNFNLMVSIFESKLDIKDLTASFVSVLMKTPKTTFEVIPSNNVERDTF